MGPTRRSGASATLEPKTPQQDPNPDKNTRKPQTPFSTTAIISVSLKSVILHDWWLVKAKGKGLAVGGFASRERLGVRVFSSAAISKRHTTTVLETADGIMITISGFINRSRTHQNGFPSELYNHFLLGFPFDWEEYAAVVILGEDSTDIAASVRNSASQKFSLSSGNNESNYLPFSLDDLPVTKARDLMMLSFGDSDYCSLVKKILSDVQRTSPNSAVGHTKTSINLNTENSSPVENGETGPETPPQHKKVKVQDDKNMITEENKKSSRKPTGGRYAPTSSNGVSTRSMARSGSTMSRRRPSLPTGVSTRSMTRRKISASMTTSSSPPSFPSEAKGN